MARRKNPTVWLAAAAVAGAVAIGYSLLKRTDGSPNQYTNKSIALTLLHSVLNAKVPLDDILLNSENVTFILPPHLLEEDVAEHMALQLLRNNYKLLRSGTIDGYFHLVKNLRPDTLVVCLADLGIAQKEPRDLGRFVGEVVCIEQDSEKVRLAMQRIFHGRH